MEDEEVQKENPKRVIQRKLEDILHTQQSLVEKIGGLEVDLMNQPDKDLEKGLGDILTGVSANFETMKLVADAFVEKLDKESASEM